MGKYIEELKTLVASRDDLRFEGDELIGRICSGWDVTIGVVWSEGDAKAALSYLREHPTPDTW